ncbi:MAG TPA: SDR family oxidoreductase [Candidatus Acidoferrum sp.]|jgi:NAD(P)-dependent dehydrogenase (short-subunit alcohol dehydrogenase family)|nr:SDR family oxidoreductase [Candidatus Acidoferrum sp.]
MINLDLSGKQAIITGSTSGIGYAIAKRMAEAGASVVVHGRTEEHVARACGGLTEEVPGVELCGQVADLTDAAAVRRLIEAVPQVDILVNNAGPTPSVPFFATTDEEWQRYSDTYILGAVRLARHYLARMIEQGWGRMLFSAGTTCSFTPGDTSVAQRMTAWITCKSAVLGLARGLAEIAAGTAVTVNAFIPGPSPSEEALISHGVLKSGRTFRDFEKEFIERPGMSSVLHRFLRPDEIADLVVFLASEQSSGITGAALRVDGGIIRSIL